MSRDMLYVVHSSFEFLRCKAAHTASDERILTRSGYCAANKILRFGSRPQNHPGDIPAEKPGAKRNAQLMVSATHALIWMIIYASRSE